MYSWMQRYEPPAKPFCDFDLFRVENKLVPRMHQSETLLFDYLNKMSILFLFCTRVPRFSVKTDQHA